jgi:hypothetical protein
MGRFRRTGNGMEDEANGRIGRIRAIGRGFLSTPG